MWIYTPTSFLSIVDKGDPTGKTLLVRARRAGDIEKVFPDADVQVGGGTDYLYRAWIDREEVANAIAESVRSIRYNNFKNQVSDHARHDAYMNCWSSMSAIQDN